MNKLKMTTVADSSNSLVVSFVPKWLEPLLNNTVSVVFRKRGPRNIVPECMYIYIGWPKSSLIGRARIHKLEWMPSQDALTLAPKGQISSDELCRYAAGYESLAVFSIGAFEAAANRLTLGVLSSRFGFSPPQSFLVLSNQGQRQLDVAAGFQPAE